MNLLVTGGCGFLGSHFIRGWLARCPKDTVTNIDCLTYAGSVDNLEEAQIHPHYQHLTIDVADAAALSQAWPLAVGLVVHFAAETHVDRSLEDAGRFVRTNALGTQMILAAARASGRPTVVVISSDEVYGPTPGGITFGTEQPLRPTSPYAASKAAGDWLAVAYAHTFGLDVTVVRSVNVFGPRQYPEKLIPLFVTRALAGESLPLYGQGRQRRCWLHVDDFVAGLSVILTDDDKRRSTPVWHLGSQDELENRCIAEEICTLCEADPKLITPVPDRPGHDQRYALDYSQTTRMFGWQPQVPFADGLRRTVEWVKVNQEWCKRRMGWRPAFLQ